MTLPKVSTVATADEAEQLAIDWQHWASEQSLSYSELADYQTYFEELAKQFSIIEELQENGIL